MNYYNEIDPKAAAWLKELIKAKAIAPGEVDERSIEDVTQNDLRGFTQHHFFAGIGAWSYALRLAGWPEHIPVWTGSCPCQPFSAAGKGGGAADERHLWPAWFHLIELCRPAIVFGEQVASPAGLMWLDTVQADMEGAGYAVGAADLCAAGVGAPHIRQRLYFVGDASGGGGGGGGGQLGNPDDAGPQGRSERRDGASERIAGPTGLAGFWRDAEWIPCRDGKWRPVEPGTFPLAHGASARVGRLRGYGNAIVAEVAQAFIEAYLDTRRAA